MLDYNALAAWAAVAASAIAVYAIWIESRRSRFALGIDLFLKLDERFGDNRMLVARRAAAMALSSENKADADDVLDFFEMVGLLVRRGALDEYVVWHNFFYWIHRYYLSAKDHIDTIQSEDPTIWADLTQLYSRLASIEKKERQCSVSQLQLTEEELTEFLNEEMSL